MEVVFDVILQEQLEDDVDGEDVLIKIDASTNLFRLVGDEFPRRGVVLGDSTIVSSLDLVGPRVADIGKIPEIGRMEDVKTDIVVPCLVGIVVIQLGQISKGQSIYRR